MHFEEGTKSKCSTHKFFSQDTIIGTSQSEIFNYPCLEHMHMKILERVAQEEKEKFPASVVQCENQLVRCSPELDLERCSYCGLCVSVLINHGFWQCTAVQNPEQHCSMHLLFWCSTIFYSPSFSHASDSSSFFACQTSPFFEPPPLLLNAFCSGLL